MLGEDIKNYKGVSTVVRDDKVAIYIDGYCGKHNKFSYEKENGLYYNDSESKVRIASIEHLKLKKEEHEEYKEINSFCFYHPFFENNPIASDVIYLDGNMEKEEVKKILKDSLKKLPFPMKDEWQEEILQEVKIESLEAELGDKVIKKITFPLATQMEAAIIWAYKSELWKKHFNRIPQKKVVKNSVFLIEKFNFKNWQWFLANIMSLEEIEKLYEANHNAAAGIIKTFEILGKSFREYISDKIYKDLYTYPLDGILTDMRKNGNDTQGAILKALSLLKNNNLTAENIKRVFANFRKLTIEREKWENSSSLLIAYLDEMLYDDVSMPDIAMVCSRAGIGQEGFRRAQELWMQNAEAIEAASVAIPTLSGKSGSYDWEMLDIRDPQWLVVGYETNCCQHLESIGGACVRYIGLNPERATCFRISKKGKTVAQSFVWFNELDHFDRRGLCFDNIEVLGQEVRDSLISCYVDYLDQAKPILKTFGFSKATVGSGYSDVALEKYFSKAKANIPIPATLNYTDANSQYEMSVID